MNDLMTLALAHPWFWPLAIILSSFVLEDPTTLATGALIAQGKISFSLGFTALMLGIFLGDLGLYFIGKLIRRKIWKSRHADYLTPSTFNVIIAKFVPGMRTITFISAGHTEIPLKRFTVSILFSAVVWTLLILQFGQKMFLWLIDYPFWVAPSVGLSLLILLKLCEVWFKRSNFKSKLFQSADV